MTERLFKVLGKDGRPCHGGNGAWSLPQGGRLGDWMPALVNIEPCERGYHLCRKSDLIHWLGPAIYEAEARGERIDSDTKIVVSEARLLRRLETWNEVTARLFAADCAEAVLPLFESFRPGDDRARKAIAAARAYARGEIGDAARAAARAAAGAAARDAAGAAAWAAAGAAAWDAARDAQTKILFRYLDGEI